MSIRSTILRIVGVACAMLVLTGRAAEAAQNNLEVCMTGEYPSLCNYSALTPEQHRVVRAAERRENLKICMAGKYSALCDYSKLTPDEAAEVRAAERRENLTVCNTGRYPALCNHGLLSADELERVQAAERATNLKVCMDGRFPALCNHSILSEEQVIAVAAAEARTTSASPKDPAPSSPRSGSGSCESGHWIDSVEGDGKIIRIEDGSMWEVDDIDTIYSSLWLPISEVIVCGSKMINVDDGESVQVTPLLLGPSSAGPSSRPSYLLQATVNDETFVINGEVFEAKTYCFNFQQGDRVIFISGSPFGVCLSAELLNMRTGNVCEVWCE